MQSQILVFDRATWALHRKLTGCYEKVASALKELILFIGIFFYIVEIHLLCLTSILLQLFVCTWNICSVEKFDAIGKLPGWNISAMNLELAPLKFTGSSPFSRSTTSERCVCLPCCRFNRVILYGVSTHLCIVYCHLTPCLVFYSVNYYINLFCSVVFVIVR